MGIQLRHVKETLGGSIVHVYVHSVHIVLPHSKDFSSPSWEKAIFLSVNVQHESTALAKLESQKCKHTMLTTVSPLPRHQASLNQKALRFCDF